MKTLRIVTGALAAALALFAAVLALTIFFGWNGDGQMYTVELIQAKLHILLWPLLIWLVLLIVTAVMELRQPKKAMVSKKPKIPERPRGARIIAIVIAAAAAVWMVVWLAMPSHFASRELENVVGNMLLHIVPAAAALLVCSWFLQRPENPKPSPSNTKVVLTARIVLAVLAVGFITVGVLNGGMRDVFVKAVNICTECVGLG